jgi:hypothetical protein
MTVTPCIAGECLISSVQPSHPRNGDTIRCEALTPKLFSDYLAKEAMTKAVILSEYSPKVIGQIAPVESRSTPKDCA